MSDHILIQTTGAIRTIRFNRPDKKNALTTAMYEALAGAIREAEDDAAIGVLILAGSQTCFSAGNDIVDFLETPPQGSDTPVVRFMAALAGAQKPVIAACNGIAIGVGVTMLLHCDFVFVGRDTRLSMPFVNIGICPEFGSSVILPALAGHVRASELLMLGAPFTPQLAVELGIANAVLPNDQTEPRAREVADKLLAQPPEALRTCKRLLKRVPAALIHEAIAVESDHFTAMLRGGESREALSAFLEKRKPDFSRKA